MDMKATPSLDNVSMAEAFLEAMGGVFRFRTIPDEKNGGGPVRKYSHFDPAALGRANADGNGVFVGVNEGGDTDASITRVRAVFFDLDVKDFDSQAEFDAALMFALEGRRSQVDPAPRGWLTPSIVVRSGGGAHVYWLVDGLPVTQFSTVQRVLSELCKGDRKVCNPSRVMRLPGSLHHKTGSPKPVQLVECSTAQRYSATH